MQPRRHRGRPEETARCADGHAAREAADTEVVHGVQGPHHARRLRDTRRHGPRALLQLSGGGGGGMRGGGDGCGGGGGGGDGGGGDGGGGVIGCGVVSGGTGLELYHN
eukprot:scaffold93775_cov62-Phaeocystis_antarctica.AAC.5